MFKLTMPCGCYYEDDSKVYFCAVHAAAPDLLNALKRLQPILWNDGPLVAAYKDVEEIVERAIAKAESRA